MKYIGENAITKLISLIKRDLATKQDSITATGVLERDTAGAINGVETVGATLIETQEATLVDVPNGLLKGDGTTISAAVPGIDYAVPSTEPVVTPHIGSNGNWFIGDTDTGKPSRGANGTDGKSAYASAQDGGFTGTEAQFNAGLSVMGSVSGIDTTVTQSSSNLITSGAVYSYIQSLDANGVKY